MRFYLSSQGVGSDPNKLLELTEMTNMKVAFIPNAKDIYPDGREKDENNTSKMSELRKMGFEVDCIDLRHFFSDKLNLENELLSYDILWVRGGNTYALLDAMIKSGFNEILYQYISQGASKIYGGYSAGICVLGPTLDGLHLVDQLPENVELPVDGLGVLPYCILPHWRSDHPESEVIEEVVSYYIDHKIPFKVLKDGEVLIV